MVKLNPHCRDNSVPPWWAPKRNDGTLLKDACRKNACSGLVTTAKAWKRARPSEETRHAHVSFSFVHRKPTGKEELLLVCLLHSWRQCVDQRSLLSERKDTLREPIYVEFRIGQTILGLPRDPFQSHSRA